jgi:hypothetical protein
VAKDARPGQELWIEWDGSGYSFQNPESIVYYTIDHIDIENELVKRALASALQRDGVCDGLGDAFKAVEKGIISSGWAGVLEADFELIACDELGESDYGDILENIQPVTWAEIDK